jgi:hypothetical protein
MQSGAVATALNLLSDSLSDIELTVSVLSQGDVAVSSDVMRLTGQADRRAEDVSTLARHLIELLRAHRPPAHNASHEVVEGLFLPDDTFRRWLNCSWSLFASGAKAKQKGLYRTLWFGIVLSAGACDHCFQSLGC